MANETDSVSFHLAHNVLELRKGLGLTQTQLSKRSEIPRSTITYIESGTGNPSLNNLSKLAIALKVSIEELLTPPLGEFRLLKSQDTPSEVKLNGGVTIHKLLPDPIPGMMIDRFEMQPGKRLPGSPHLAGSREYLVCLKGEVLIAVAGSKFSLKKGDTFAFPGNNPHSYENTGHHPNILISIVIIK